jgi:hypothetical protein
MLEKKDKKSIRNNIIATLAATGIFSLVSYLAGIIPWILSLLANILKWFMSYIEIPIWLFVLIVVLLLSIIFKLFKSLYIKGNKLKEATNIVISNKNTGLVIKDYKEDIIYNLKWRWNYTSVGEIVNINPFCPYCDFQVYPRRTSSYRIIDNIGFKCEDCGRDIIDFEHNYQILVDKVVRVIQKNIRNDLWQDKVINKSTSV